MALLLRYSDEFSAHLARSKLLAHGIVAGVVHDHAATLWCHWLMRPRLVVDDADIEQAVNVLATPDLPIEDDFIEPQDPGWMSEDLGLQRALPGFFESVGLGAVFAGGLGLSVVALMTACAILLGHTGDERDLEVSPALLPFFGAIVGAVGGAFVSPLLAFTRTCRRDGHGDLPARARMIYLPLALLYGGAIVLLAALPILAGKAVWRALTSGLRNQRGSPS